MKIFLSADHHFHNYQQFSHQIGLGINNRLFEMLMVDDFVSARVLEASKAEKRSGEWNAVHIRAGDLFDRKNVIDTIVYNEVSQRVRFAAESIPQIILKGNHDQAGGGVRNSLEAIGAIRNVDGTSSITVVGFEPKQISVGNIAVTLVPYHDDPEVLKRWFHICSPHPEPSCWAILVAHCAVEGARTGSEFPVPGAVTLKDLEPEKWDQVFLGHIHHPQSLAENVHYIGSMCQRNFADEGPQRSIVVYGDDGCWKRHLLPGPRFITCKLETKKELQNLGTIEEYGYYRILCGPSVPIQEVKQHFAGNCLNFCIQPTGAERIEAEGNGAPRISAELKKWEDITDAYVDLVKPDLDWALLKQMGRQIVGTTTATK